MLVFEERRKLEYPEKNLPEQGRKLTTYSTHILRQIGESILSHIGRRRVLSPLRNPRKTGPLVAYHSSFKSYRLTGANQELPTTTHVTKDLAVMKFRSSFKILKDPNTVKVQPSFGKPIIQSYTYMRINGNNSLQD